MKYRIILLFIMAGCNTPAQKKHVIVSDTVIVKSIVRKDSLIKRPDFNQVLRDYFDNIDKYEKYRILESDAENLYQATGNKKYEKQFYEYQRERVKYAKLAGNFYKQKP